MCLRGIGWLVSLAVGPESVTCATQENIAPFVLRLLLQQVAMLLAFLPYVVSQATQDAVYSFLR
jgi:hypothetical protein